MPPAALVRAAARLAVHRAPARDFAATVEVQAQSVQAHACLFHHVDVRREPGLWRTRRPCTPKHRATSRGLPPCVLRGLLWETVSFHREEAVTVGPPAFEKACGGGAGSGAID